MARPVVTFDLFSALLDSRSGGGRAVAEMGSARGWPVDGETVYDRWDRLNKAAEGRCRPRHEVDDVRTLPDLLAALATG